MPSSNGLRRGYADTPLGQLHYLEQGSGPALLLLHQTPRSADEFRELMPLLAVDHRVIAMDLLGFGLSAPLPAPQTIEAIAAGGIALLDALGIERAALLGHHTGALVAIEMAASEPARVAAVVLSSSPWVDASYRESRASGPGVDQVQQSADGSHLTRLWQLRRPYYPADRADLLDRFIRDALAPGVDPAEGHRACARYRMEDRIGLVIASVLLIGGTADPFSFPALEPIQAHLTAAVRTETAVLSGGTIPLMEQLAPAVAVAVRKFLR